MKRSAILYSSGLDQWLGKKAETKLLSCDKKQQPCLWYSYRNNLVSSGEVVSAAVSHGKPCQFEPGQWHPCHPAVEMNTWVLFGAGDVKEARHDAHHITLLCAYRSGKIRALTSYLLSGPWHNRVTITGINIIISLAPPPTAVYQ